MCPDLLDYLDGGLEVGLSIGANNRKSAVMMVMVMMVMVGRMSASFTSLLCGCFPRLLPFWRCQQPHTCGGSSRDLQKEKQGEQGHLNGRPH